MTSDALEIGSPANSPCVPTQTKIEELHCTCYNYQNSTIKLVRVSVLLSK